MAEEEIKNLCDIKRIEVARNIFRGVTEVFISGREQGTQNPVVLGENGWAPHPEVGERAFPLLRFSEEHAQQLANGLWEAGIRPNQAAGSAGQLEATNKHLEDIKKVAFMLLEGKVGVGVGFNKD